MDWPARGDVVDDRGDEVAKVPRRGRASAREDRGDGAVVLGGLGGASDAAVERTRMR